MLSIVINQRHKIGLFLLAVAAGLCLLAGATFREACGTLLLGCAFIWAFGGDNRALHGCLAAVGTIVALLPLAAGLYDQSKARDDYRQRVSTFEKQLPILAKDHPDLAAGFVTSEAAGPSDGPWADYRKPAAPDSGFRPALPLPKLPPGAVLVPITRTVSVPALGDVQFPVTMSGKEIATTLQSNQNQPKVPQWYIDALNAGIDAAAINGLENPGLAVVPPSIGDTVRSSLPTEALGIGIVIAFMGAFIVTRPRRLSAKHVIRPD